MLRLVIAAMVVVLAAGMARAERRVALVIGEDDYKTIRKLDNAVADAQAVGAMLEKLGFEVTLETDRNLKRTRRALEDFSEDSEGADVALVYYAGHGVEIAGDNRLLPTDADASSLDALEASTLPLEEVRETVAGIAKVGLIILDACRNDPFGTAGAPSAQAGTQDDAVTGREISPTSNGSDSRSAVAIGSDVVEKAKPGLGRIGRAEGILFAFSAAPGETAADGADGHSPFAEALVKYLGTDGLEVRSALTLVQQEVYDLSRGRQLPYVESGLPSLFFAATTKEQLPERERLLLAMADITPDLRGEVELIAAKADMPLAPLYGALIGSDVGSMSAPQRGRKLQEAADAFVKVRADMRALASDDPEVTKLRRQAEQQLALGAFDTARITLAAAADVDSNSRKTLKENLIARTISEAATHYLAGGAARADLRYELAIGDYEEAVSLYEEIENFDLADKDRYQHIALLEEIGLLQRTVGNLPAAGAAYRRMEALAQRQGERAPDNLDWQFNLAVAKGNTADVLYQQGNLNDALTVYIDEQKILQAIVQKDINNARWPDWMRTQAAVVNRIGDIARNSGNHEGSLKAYRLALEITEKLVNLEPGATILRYDMAICHYNIGMALRLLNDFQGALAEFDVALSIAEELSAKEPDKVEYRRHMTANLNWIGDLRRFGNDPAAALSAYERSRAITEALIKKDPNGVDDRRDLSVVLAKIGDTRQMLGELDAALELHRSAMAIAEYLAGIDATNATWQRDLSIAHNRVGDLLLAKGDTTGAGVEYKAGFEIARTLLDADTGDTQRILDVIYSRYKLAMAGIDRLDNLTRVSKALAAIKENGTLPVAYEGWIAMVNEALKATPAQ